MYVSSEVGRQRQNDDGGNMNLTLFIISLCFLSILYWRIRRERKQTRYLHRDMDVITKLSELSVSVKQKAKLYQDMVDICRSSASCDRASLLFYNENAHNLHVVAVSGGRKMAEERVFNIGE